MVRDLIEETYPELFQDFNGADVQPGGFYKGNAARERIWKTKSGKAEFTVPDAPVGDRRRGCARPLPADDPALQRSVQHHHLRL